MTIPNPDDALMALPDDADAATIIAEMQDWHIGFLLDMAEAEKPNGGEFGARAYRINDYVLGPLIVDYRKSGSHLLSMEATEAFLRLKLVETKWPKFCDCGNAWEEEDEEWSGEPKCDGSCQPPIRLTDRGREILRLDEERRKAVP